MPTIAELDSKRRNLIELANGILKKAHEDKREGLSAEDEQEWQRLHDEANRLKSHGEMLKKQEETERSLGEPEPRQTAANLVATEPRRDSYVAMRDLRRGQADANRALKAWLLAPAPGVTITAEDRAAAERVGLNLASRAIDINLSTMSMRSLSREDIKEWEYRSPYEYRAQSTLTGAAGQFTIPDEMMRPLEKALLSYGGMRQRSTIVRTETGAALPWPTVNDTANKGEIIAENTAANEQDMVFAQLVLDSYLYSSKMVRCSIQFLQDNAVNAAAVLGELLGERIGRITNDHFTVGTGTGQPQGIVPAATVGVTAGVGTTQVTTWTYPSMVALEHSVDPAYRSGAAFMMADSSLAKTKSIVDNQGRPLWAPGIIGGQPDTLLGYPVVINQSMAAMAANAKSVLFGDLSKYIIRDVLGIQLMRLEERYAEFHQVAFLAYSRHDGDLLNAGTGPVKVFVNAAS